MTNATLENYYTEEEVSKILDKTIATLRADACRRKGAPRTKLGKRILYRIDAFNSWIMKHETDFDKLRKV
ncbi:MAG: hypothetical protein ACJAZX_000085 [Rickettsiales bacterium]|jgi:hypothetical protein